MPVAVRRRSPAPCRSFSPHAKVRAGSEDQLEEETPPTGAPTCEDMMIVIGAVDGFTCVR